MKWEIMRIILWFSLRKTKQNKKKTNIYSFENLLWRYQLQTFLDAKTSKFHSLISFYPQSWSQCSNLSGETAESACRRANDTVSQVTARLHSAINSRALRRRRFELSKPLRNLFWLSTRPTNQTHNQQDSSRLRRTILHCESKPPRMVSTRISWCRRENVPNL